MIKQGTLPLAQQDKAIAAIQSGGKTVDELTGIVLSILVIVQVKAKGNYAGSGASTSRQC